MEKIAYYQELYKIQDRVLTIIFGISNEFYLTGGTCISRYYQPKRYSDDLDFFSNFSNIFNLEVKNIKYELSKQFEIKTEVESKDFIRIIVDNKLQVDFVNDRVKRCGKIIDKDGILIDNIENIFANKLTAILGRDDPKDIFDLYLIDKFYKIDYVKTVNCAKEKMMLNIEDLIIRLKTFPTKWLNEINLIDREFLKEFELKQIMNKIREQNNETN